MRWILLGVGLAAAAAAAVPLVKIGPRNLWGMLRYDQRQAGDLRVGQKAPDVVLTALDGSRVRLGERLGQRPFVLVFGSYT